MQRYFFDFAAGTCVQFDFVGRELLRVEQARDHAQLLALDMVCTDREWRDAVEVQVRNIDGDKLFTVPVRMMAA